METTTRMWHTIRDSGGYGVDIKDPHLFIGLGEFGAPGRKKSVSCSYSSKRC